MGKRIPGKCYYELETGLCGRKTKTYKYICDKHAEEVETVPYGRFCEFCGIDTFQSEHKRDCPLVKIRPLLEDNNGRLRR